MTIYHPQGWYMDGEGMANIAGKVEQFRPKVSESEKITIIQLVPALFRPLVVNELLRPCVHLRRVFCGGAEAILLSRCTTTRYP